MARLKGTIKDMRVTELARAVQARDAVLNELNQVRSSLRAAAERRCQGLSGPEWRLWDDYARAVEVKAAQREQELVDWETIVSEQRQLAAHSYREAEMWSRLAHRRAEAERIRSRQLQQRALDEQAIQRTASAWRTHPQGGVE